MSWSTPFTILFLGIFTHLVFIPSFWRLKFPFTYGSDAEDDGGGGDDEDNDNNQSRIM